VYLNKKEEAFLGLREASPLVYELGQPEY